MDAIYMCAHYGEKLSLIRIENNLIFLLDTMILRYCLC